MRRDRAYKRGDLYYLDAVAITVTAVDGYILSAWDDREGVHTESPYWRAEVEE